MNPAQGESVVIMPSLLITAASTHQMHFDCRKFNWLTLDVLFSTAHTDQDAPDVLKLTDSDITDATGFGAIVKFTGGTSVVADSTGFVIPDFGVAGGGAIEFQVDLRERKRYLMLSITTGAITYSHFVTAIGRLSRAEQPETGAGEKHVVNLDNATCTQQLQMIVGPSATSDT